MDTLRQQLAQRLIDRKWNPNHEAFTRELDELMAIFTPVCQGIAREAVQGAPAHAVKPTVSGKQVDKPSEARFVFDTLMNYCMAHQDVPQDMLETIDNVANYFGDIATGRTK